MKIAVLVALQLEAAAVDHELGAFLDAEIDVAPDLVEMRARHHRAVVGLRVGRGPDLEALDARDELLHQASAVFSPTGTATDTAMQRSPAEP